MDILVSPINPERAIATATLTRDPGPTAFGTSRAVYPSPKSVHNFG